MGTNLQRGDLRTRNNMWYKRELGRPVVHYHEAARRSPFIEKNGEGIMGCWWFYANEGLYVDEDGGKR